VSVVLRPYQAEAAPLAIDAMRTGRSTLVILPTGTGKTTLFVEIVRRVLAEHPHKRALILADRAELVYQAAARVQRMTGEAGDIEMGQEHRADRYQFSRARVVVASKDSLHASRITKFNKDEFAIVVVDEADLSIAASYTSILDYFASAWVLGVTATPGSWTRLSKVYSSIAYSMSLLQGIEQGWLVEPHQEYCPIESIDISGVGTNRGDLNQAELAAELEFEKPLLGIASAVLQETNRLGREEKTLVFAASVSHAQRLAEILNRPGNKPGSARFVTGSTPKDERRQLFRDYLDAKFQYLVNFGVTVRGFDDPSIRVVAVARPTKSASLFEQMLGRGTRTLPGVIDGVDTAAERLERIAFSGKPFVRVLDFVGNCGEHKLSDALTLLGAGKDERVIRRARKLLKGGEAGGQGVTAVISEAERQLAAEKKAREEREAEARRRGIHGRAAYHKQRVSLYERADTMPDRRPAWRTGKPATRGQCKFLARQGMKNPENLSAGQAGALIGRIRVRYKKGLCNFRQAQTLKRHGIDPVPVSYERASRIIDALARNGWRPLRPEEVPA